ncbi:MAG TPA: YciI family protein [Actinomycetota bacterium]|nr:YciI family protein [Actinomycetota bacterium]
MDYLYLIWEGGQDAETADRADVMRDMLAWTAGLVAQGNLRGGAPLQAGGQARSVKRRGGAASVIDGPYAETKEVIGGFCLVDAASMEEAVAIAEGCPAARYGAVEIREILPLQ